MISEPQERFASVRFATVVPTSSVLGGLVGEAVLAGGDMSFVSVRADSITGTSGHVGGLVGIGHQIPLISSSFVRVGEIRGANYVGGLAGLSSSTSAPCCYCEVFLGGGGQNSGFQ